MNSNFASLGVTPPILKALDEMGFETPTEVQSRTIPHILNKEDVIVKSKTGSGKTAVFGISMLQLIEAGVPGPQGLILTPTRELAVQIDSDLKISANICRINLSRFTVSTISRRKSGFEQRRLHRNRTPAGLRSHPAGAP